MLTGGIIPHPNIRNLIARSGIPVLMSKDDTYKVTSEIHDLTVKIKPDDINKADMAIKMVEDHIDKDLLIKKIS